MISVWLIALVASLGGLAVFVGLCMEKMAERTKGGYQTIKDFRKSGTRKKIGERLVRWGVFAEMVLGFSVAAFEGCQSYRNAPLNQPVSTIEATAVVAFSQTNLPNPTFSSLNESYLELIGTNIYGESFFGLIPKSLPRVFLNKQPGNGEINFAGVVFEFENNPAPPFSDIFKATSSPNKTTVRQALDEITGARIRLDFVPRRELILGGHVTIRINGIEKQLVIPHQSTSKQFSEGNPRAPGVLFFATNSIP